MGPNASYSSPEAATLNGLEVLKYCKDPLEGGSPYGSPRTRNVVEVYQNGFEGVSEAPLQPIPKSKAVGTDEVSIGCGKSKLKTYHEGPDAIVNVGSTNVLCGSSAIRPKGSGKPPVRTADSTLDKDLLSFRYRKRHCHSLGTCRSRSAVTVNLTCDLIRTIEEVDRRILRTRRVDKQKRSILVNPIHARVKGNRNLLSSSEAVTANVLSCSAKLKSVGAAAIMDSSL